MKMNRRPRKSLFGFPDYRAVAAPQEAPDAAERGRGHRRPSCTYVTNPQTVDTPGEGAASCPG
jgi:hypothetical protein